MAYRIKGVLTLKQRRVAREYIYMVYNLISNPDISESTKVLVKEIFYPWIRAITFALYYDDCMMIEKATRTIEIGEKKV